MYFKYLLDNSGLQTLDTTRAGNKLAMKLPLTYF